MVINKHYPPPSTSHQSTNPSLLDDLHLLPVQRHRAEARLEPALVVVVVLGQPRRVGDVDDGVGLLVVDAPDADRLEQEGPRLAEDLLCSYVRVFVWIRVVWWCLCQSSQPARPNNTHPLLSTCLIYMSVKSSQPARPHSPNPRPHINPTTHAPPALDMSMPRIVTAPVRTQATLAWLGSEKKSFWSRSASGRRKSEM